MKSVENILRRLAHAPGVGRLVRWPLNLVSPQRVVKIPFGSLRGIKWVVGSAGPASWLGLYEQYKQSQFVEQIKLGDVVYDIGANVGMYTLLGSRLVGKNGKVLAFEPLPRNLQFLRNHIELNRATNTMVFEVAVSDRRGIARFDDTRQPEAVRLSSSGRMEVKTVQLDELVAQQGLPLPRVMKIDVEGAEMLVLSGAKTILRESRPKIFLATHGPAVHRECCNFLHSLEYELVSLNNRPIQNSDELLATPATADRRPMSNR